MFTASIHRNFYFKGKVLLLEVIHSYRSHCIALRVCSALLCPLLPFWTRSGLEGVMLL